MQICKYASMEVWMNASMQVECEYATRKVYNYPPIIVFRQNLVLLKGKLKVGPAQSNLFIASIGFREKIRPLLFLHVPGFKSFL